MHYLLKNFNKILLLLFIGITWSQWFTINHDSIIRTYYVSYPETSDFSEPPALIIKMHGYGGTAQSQLS